MPVDRKKILAQLGYYKDPIMMKRRYGIEITMEQVRMAERAIARYKALPEADLKRMDEKTAMVWPYKLTERQRYDKAMHEAGTDLTVTQNILWNQVRTRLEADPGRRKTDGKAICAALLEIEQFLQLNMYLGNFEENQEIIQGNKTDEIMNIFEAAYRKHTRNP